MAKSKTVLAHPEMKLLNNNAYVAELERRLGDKLKAHSLLFGLVVTPTGGNEYRPFERFVDKEWAKTLRFFVRKPTKKVTYAELDKDNNEFDFADGLVKNPVTLLQVQIGAFGQKAPAQAEPDNCVLCGKDIALCGGRHETDDVGDGEAKALPVTEPAAEPVVEPAPVVAEPLPVAEVAPPLPEGVTVGEFLDQAVAEKAAEHEVAEPAADEPDDGVRYRRSIVKGKTRYLVVDDPFASYDYQLYRKVGTGKGRRYLECGPVVREDVPAAAE